MNNRLVLSVGAAVAVLVGGNELAPAVAFVTPLLSTTATGSNGAVQLSQRRGQDNRRGNLGGTRRDDYCLVNPGYGEEVWSLEPLFIWRGNLDRVALQSLGGESDLLDLEISPATDGTFQSIYESEPLQPGTEYEWRWFTGRDQRGFPFQTMAEGEERDRITADLAQLQDELETQGADAETIAQARADYFLQNNLLTDRLQALFSVDNPSEAFVETRNAVVEEICKQELGF